MHHNHSPPWRVPDEPKPASLQSCPKCASTNTKGRFNALQDIVLVSYVFCGFTWIALPLSP